MGRSIYADEVGSEKGNAWVHKFWVGVQDSDVSEYLDAWQPSYLLADLNVADEADIKTTMLEVKQRFKTLFGLSYKKYMAGDEPNQYAESQAVRSRQQLASTINLGEHLLATIRNMKTAGIEEQQLTIEY